MKKPLGCKNYGSIPHLPNSRMGPADHACHEGQARIATQKARDRKDVVYVLEKLDGSNVGIARVGDDIHALGRVGYLAETSPHEQHHLFANWVRGRADFWRGVLKPGQRLVGEWMAQVHSTRYALPHGPFAAFDLMAGFVRAPFPALQVLCERNGIPMPKVLHVGGPLSVETAMELHGAGAHGCLDEPEGAVWRVERGDEVDFLVKWVRPDKVDGKFLPGVEEDRSSAREVVWNWRPERAA